MAKKITKEAEARIVDGIERAIDLVDGGWTPNDALIKIAEDGDYPAGHIRMMVQAYNTGRTNYQRKTASSLFEKIATFPVADAAVILEAVFPERPKVAADLHRETAVSDSYQSAPIWRRDVPLEKVASVNGDPARPHPRDPDRLVKKAFDLMSNLDREREALRLEVSRAQEKIAKHLSQLDEHFRRVNRDVSFPAVRENAGLVWGETARQLLTKVAEANLRLEKEASRDCWAGRVDQSAVPYCYVRDCLAAVNDYHTAQDAFQAFDKDAAAMKGQLLGSYMITPPPEPLTPFKSILTKMAFGGIKGFGMTPDLIAADTVKNIVSRLKPRDDDKLKTDAFMAVTDPSHESRLRKIRTSAIMHDLLANDEFISGEHPERVAEMFNHISNLAPRAAEQPILMKALLRRYIAQGQVDPHDIDQLVGMETRLKGLDDPQREVNLPKLPGSNIVQPGKSPPPPMREE